MIDSEPTLLQRDAVWTCATWQGLIVLVWRGEATADRAALNVRFLREFAVARPGGFGIVVVLEDAAIPPDERVKKMMAEAMRQLGPRIHGAAYFVPLQGFKGSLLRSVITGLSLVAREPYPTQAFSRLPDAARWLCGRLPPGRHSPAPARVEALVERLRELS